MINTLLNNKLAVFGLLATTCLVVTGVRYLVSFAILPSQLPHVDRKADISRAEVTEVKAEDGSKIQISELKCDDNNDKVLIVFNPNGMVKQEFLNNGSHIENFKSQGYGKVVFWDYPNTGESKSSSFFATKKGLVNAGVAVAEHVAKGKYDNVYFYGWSLGGGIAAETALELQNKGFVIGGIILDRTFTSINEFLYHNIGIYPKLASAITWSFGLDINTETCFNALTTPNKRVLFVREDKVIKMATFGMHSDAGSTASFVELFDATHESPHAEGSKHMQF